MEVESLRLGFSVPRRQVSPLPDTPLGVTVFGDALSPECLTGLADAGLNLIRVCRAVESPLGDELLDACVRLGLRVIIGLEQPRQAGIIFHDPHILGDGHVFEDLIPADATGRLDDSDLESRIAARAGEAVARWGGHPAVAAWEPITCADLIPDTPSRLRLWRTGARAIRGAEHGRPGPALPLVYSTLEPDPTPVPPEAGLVLSGGSLPEVIHPLSATRVALCTARVLGAAIPRAAVPLFLAGHCSRLHLEDAGRPHPAAWLRDECAHAAMWAHAVACGGCPGLPGLEGWDPLPSIAGLKAAFADAAAGGGDWPWEVIPVGRPPRAFVFWAPCARVGWCLRETTLADARRIRDTARNADGDGGRGWRVLALDAGERLLADRGLEMQSPYTRRAIAYLLRRDAAGGPAVADSHIAASLDKMDVLSRLLPDIAPPAHFAYPALGEPALGKVATGESAAGGAGGMEFRLEGLGPGDHGVTWMDDRTGLATGRAEVVGDAPRLTPPAFDRHLAFVIDREVGCT